MIETTEEPLTNFTLAPLDDRLVVKRDDPEKDYRGVIIIPDRAKTTKVIGTVTAVGPGKPYKDADGQIQFDPMFIRPGDRVLFGLYSGTDVRWGSETITILHAGDVIALVRRKDTPE